MDIKLVEKLKDLGADGFSHLNGSLMAHLKGTYELLKNWGNDEILCNAGLFHAVYSTSGYKEQLIILENRNVIKSIIGSDAEKIVYNYCACDRDNFWPKIGNILKPTFKDRFTGDEYIVETEWLQNFCELTLANELEIAENSETFIKEFGAELWPLFIRMKPYVSSAAYGSFCELSAAK